MKVTIIDYNSNDRIIGLIITFDKSSSSPFYM